MTYLLEPETQLLIEVLMKSYPRYNSGNANVVVKELPSS